MIWVERNKKFVKEIREYIQCFENQKPDIFTYFDGSRSYTFPFSIESESGLKLLLIYASLYQDLSEEHLSEYVIKLYQQYKEELFNLEEVSFADLQSYTMSEAKKYRWELTPKIPGILKSLTDFFSQVKELNRYLQQGIDTEKIVYQLTHKIFYMGKTSLNKFKSRYFMWLVLNVYSEWSSFLWTEKSLLPITPGAQRFLYFLGPLKSSRGTAVSQRERIKVMSQLFKKIEPREPWRYFTAFESFQKPLSTFSNVLYQCQKVLNGCENCPITNECQGDLF